MDIPTPLCLRPRPLVKMSDLRKKRLVLKYSSGVNIKETKQFLDPNEHLIMPGLANPQIFSHSPETTFDFLLLS